MDDDRNALRVSSGGKGGSRPTFQWLRGRLHRCNETLSLCGKVLEDLGVLKINNVYVWNKDGKQVRTANLYLPHFQGEIPEPPPEVVADKLPAAGEANAGQGVDGAHLRAVRPAARPEQHPAAGRPADTPRARLIHHIAGRPDPPP